MVIYVCMVLAFVYTGINQVLGHIGGTLIYGDQMTEGFNDDISLG